MDASALVELIRLAFSETPAPDPDNLRGSNEGDEPYLLEDEFHEVPAWSSLDAEFLDSSPDGFGTALCFFSNVAFRYYLPAFLIADVANSLSRVEPAFFLWSGVDDEKREQPVNARRYGAWTWFEAKATQFEGFSREEVEAIVAYLRFIVDRDRFVRGKIEQALRNFWIPRRSYLASRRQ